MTGPAQIFKQPQSRSPTHS